jgi:hypothetical protein
LDWPILLQTADFGISGEICNKEIAVGVFKVMIHAPAAFYLERKYDA